MQTPSHVTSPKRSAWLWVPSLYFAEGIPYVVVMIVSVIMYKRLGISNTKIALYTSWLYLPWVIKPLWSPIVDIVRTKRYWILVMQLAIGAGLAGVALTIPADRFLQYTLAFLWLLAFSSATHDIAADGFYMLGLSQHDQAWFVGVRSTFYRLAMITGQGLLVMLAGYLESATGLPPVTLQVEARPAAQPMPLRAPEPLLVTHQQGALRILAQSGNATELLRHTDVDGGRTPARRTPSRTESLTLTLETRSRNDVDAYLDVARQWNRRHGFYTVDSPAASPGEAADDRSGWLAVVIGQLEGFLRRWFGPEYTVADPHDQAGNCGVIYFMMSNRVPTGETVVVNFTQTSGDPSIRILEGDRFTFTEENADQPFMAVVGVDPKLRAESRAVFKARSGNIPLAWAITFYVLAGLFGLFFVYHRFVLPKATVNVPQTHRRPSDIGGDFVKTLLSFFAKKHAVVAIAFLLFYRFSEAQLVKIAPPFLLDPRAIGGLGLTTGQVGFVYGTVGILMLTAGGLLGGFLAATHGLKRWLWWMVLAINLPNAVYVFLSYVRPENFLVVNAAVGVEQFGYGFGFTAYMLFMIVASQGTHKTAHYAICTGFMALGMMLPGMCSGWLQELIGYRHFFVWVLIATIPSFLVTALVPLDPNFGKKQRET